MAPQVRVRHLSLSREPLSWSVLLRDNADSLPGPFARPLGRDNSRLPLSVRCFEWKAVPFPILSADNRPWGLYPPHLCLVSMALDPIEWIVIGVIVVVIFMWGPSKIPELAKSIGLARKELDNAKLQIANPTQALVQAATQSTTPMAATNTDDLLIQTARKMGVVTEGKTREQITNEMVSRAAKTQTTQTS
jgi:sec-independent protein translocase protein TatA